jgi:hypothetical protein
VPKRVRVNPFQACSVGCCIHDVADRLASQRLPAFAQKQPRQLAVALPQVLLDRSQLVTWNRLFYRQAVFQTSNPQSSLLEVHIGDLHGDDLARAKAMTVRHQQEKVVADAMPPLLGTFQQPVDFRLVEEIFVPLVEVSGRGA